VLERGCWFEAHSGGLQNMRVRRSSGAAFATSGDVEALQCMEFLSVANKRIDVSL
jgi:hypothetical protein